MKNTQVNLALQLGLPENTLTQIQQCFKLYPDVQWAIIYGSRATGHFEKSSDIDIAYDGPRKILAELKTILDELPTPYLFDVTHYESLQNEALKTHIETEGIRIYPQL